MTFTFDNTTGAYEILFTADSAHPFLGAFRLNVNLFNPDTGTTAPDPALFHDTFNDFNLTSPNTTVALSGTSSRLLAWDAGDRVAASGPVPLGVPDGAFSFRSGVFDLPLSPTKEDRMADGKFATIVAVPEPSITLLLGAGIAGFSLWHWRRSGR